MTLDKRKDVLTIVLGLLGGIKFRFIGTFYASEILILIICFLVTWKPLFSNKYSSNIFKLAVFWLISATITDTYINNTFINSLKGEFNIIFFILQFPIIYWLLYDKPTRFLYYIIAVGIVSIPNLYLFGPEYDEDNAGAMGENIWLFYAMVPVAVAIISSLYYKKKINDKTCCILMAGFGIYMLFHNSRNVFLTMSMASILMYQIGKYNGLCKFDRIKIFSHNIFATFLLLLIGAAIVNTSYSFLASNRILGDYAYYKYLRQSKADNILEGGRSQTLLGIELIKQSPIIGYGCFAKDEDDSFHKEYAKKHNKKYVKPLNERRMPAHSHIVGAWMENGIGGGLFWLYILSLMWRFFKNGAILYVPKLLPAVLMTFTATCWDILFSPFGSRVPTTFFLMYISIVYLDYKKSIPQISPYA